jgi:hypothetical protein
VRGRIVRGCQFSSRVTVRSAVEPYESWEIAPRTATWVACSGRRLAHLYRADGATRLLGPEEELAIPDLFGDVHVLVGRFFE